MLKIYSTQILTGVAKVAIAHTTQVLPAALDRHLPVDLKATQLDGPGTRTPRNTYQYMLELIEWMERSSSELNDVEDLRLLHYFQSVSESHAAFRTLPELSGATLNVLSTSLGMIPITPNGMENVFQHGCIGDWTAHGTSQLKCRQKFRLKP